MMKFAANLVSTILIPFFIPTYLFCIIFIYFPQLSNLISTAAKVQAVAGIFAVTTLLPILFVFVLYKLNIVSSPDLYKRQDRYIPQLFSTITYLLLSLYLFFRLGLHSTLTLAVMASSVSLLLLTLINRYWKISTHTTGSFGMLGAVSVLYFQFPGLHFTVLYFVIFFSAIAVAFARWYLKAHTTSQIIAGCCLGFFTGSSLFYFLLT